MRYAWLMLPLFIALALFTAGGKSPQTALVGGTVIPDSDSTPVANAVVLIEGDRIKAVGSAGEVSIPPGVKHIDARGAWIIPGLIDAHIHFFQSGGLYTRPDIIDLRRFRPYKDEVASVRRNIKTTLARYLASGVTSVADFGGPRWTFEVRALAQSTPPAPRVAVSGPLIATWVPPELSAAAVDDPPLVEVRTAEEARAAVGNVLGLHPDYIKLWFIHRPGDDLERHTRIVRSAIEAAHGAGLRAVVHATELQVARAAVDAGADILAHSVEDRPIDDEFIQQLRNRGVIYIPTLMVYEGYRDVLGGKVELTDIERRLGDPQAIATFTDINKVGTRTLANGASLQATMAANLRRIHHAGVTIAAGTDAGNIGTLHGPALHRELEMMVAAGMEPRAVLRAATQGGAKVMGRDKELGMIAPGQLADLVVLDGDPLADIRNTQRIRLVVKNGEVFEQGDMLPASQQRTSVRSSG